MLECLSYGTGNISQFGKQNFVILKWGGGCLKIQNILIFEENSSFRMFGTFESERDSDIVYGLVDQPQFWNPVKHQVLCSS